MTELNRAQLCSWESTLQLAADALDNPRGGTARFQARLRGTMIGLREAVEALKRMAAEGQLARHEQAETRSQLERVVKHLPLPYLLTTVDGDILAANDAAGATLNVAPRALVRRNLLVFMDDRHTWLQALAETAGSGAPFRRVCNVRPRERGQQRLLASVSAAGTGSSATILWFLLTATTETLQDTGMAHASGRRHARAS